MNDFLGHILFCRDSQAWSTFLVLYQNWSKRRWTEAPVLSETRVQIPLPTPFTLPSQY